MLQIHDVMLDAITTMRPMVLDIERHDRDLASQLKRAASSVALNVAEGSGSFGGVRTQRYRTASARRERRSRASSLQNASATSNRCPRLWPPR